MEKDIAELIKEREETYQEIKKKLLPLIIEFIKEAKKTYYELRRELTDDIALDRRVLLMREAMEAFLLLEKHISSLEDKNLQLQKNLRKRESALKRLRELALGS
jgi:hypothetical protein